MSEAIRAVHHGNHWVIVVAGAIAVAALLVPLILRTAPQRTASLALLVLVASLTLQGLLGAGLLASLTGPAFHGRRATGVAHISGGVVALVLAVVAVLVQRSTSRRKQRTSVTALVCAVIAMLAGGEELVAVVLVPAAAVMLLVLSRRTSAPALVAEEDAGP